jgi:hypothetical protein
MTARRILDAIADVVILVALVVAGIGQFMPWMRIRPDRTRTLTSAIKIALPAEASPAWDVPTPEALVEFQMWHVTRSGAALAVAGVLVVLSLTLNLGAGARKLLVVLMFASLAAAICFEVMIYTPLPITPAHVEFGQLHLDQQDGFLVALVPTIIAAVICAVRMVWTIAWRSKRDADRPPALA